MANTASADRGTEAETVAVRLPEHLISRIDAKVQRMKDAAPGVHITRSDAMRALLLVGLAAEEG